MTKNINNTNNKKLHKMPISIILKDVIVYIVLNL